MEDCIFCEIVNRQIPSKIVFEDDTCLAFEDIAPQAPVHILVIPKAHVANVFEASKQSDAFIASLIRVANQVAEERGLNKTGYRLVTNCGADAQQSVHHMHIHILGGGELSGQMA